MHPDAAQHPTQGCARHRDIVDHRREAVLQLTRKNGALRLALPVTHFT
jgi:hypothetical protein